MQNCISYKFGHHLHCHFALDCPIGIVSLYRVDIFINQSHIS